MGSFQSHPCGLNVIEEVPWLACSSRCLCGRHDADIKISGCTEVLKSGGNRWFLSRDWLKLMAISTQISCLSSSFVLSLVIFLVPSQAETYRCVLLLHCLSCLAHVRPIEPAWKSNPPILPFRTSSIQVTITDWVLGSCISFWKDSCPTKVVWHRLSLNPGISEAQAERDGQSTRQHSHPTAACQAHPGKDCHRSGRFHRCNPVCGIGTLTFSS